jgi:hypothetical protein
MHSVDPDVAFEGSKVVGLDDAAQTRAELPAVAANEPARQNSARSEEGLTVVRYAVSGIVGPDVAFEGWKVVGLDGAAYWEKLVRVLLAEGLVAAELFVAGLVFAAPVDVGLVVAGLAGAGLAVAGLVADGLVVAGPVVAAGLELGVLELGLAVQDA